MDTSPDILWLSLESVRADHTPMYGYERNTTPNLQRLAAQSATSVLDNGIAQSLWTPAVSASMLTGTYLSTHRVGQDGRAEKKLPKEVGTLPELLRAEGYDTALFTPNPYVSEATGLDRGFDHTKSVQAIPESYIPFRDDFWDYLSEGIKTLLRAGVASPSRMKKELKTTENEVLERHATRWLSSSSRDSDSFFAYAHIPGPHHPYLPSSENIDRFTDDIEFSAEQAFSLVEDVYYGGATELKKQIAQGAVFSKDELAAIKAMYDATLWHMDETVGRIIEAARAASDDLIVVVVGDHGESFGESGLLGHNLELHDSVIRVPMLVSGIPGVETDSSTLTQQIDLTYTIGAIAGVSTDQFEGRDIRDGERDFAIAQRGEAHLEAYTSLNPDFDTSRFFEHPYTCVRTEDYKLATGEARTELYELPDENTDRSNQYPEKTEELQEVVENENLNWSHTSERSGSEFSESQLSQLEDLGYLS